MSFKARLESKISWLRSIPNVYIVEAKVNPPIQEELITQRQQALGFELDERFLNYFRECNGWSIQWIYTSTPPADARAELERMILAQETWSYGRFTVPSLLTRAGDRGREPQLVEVEHTLRFLGGIEDRHLRQSSYEITAYGSYPQPNQSMTQYNDILLYTSAAHPDPICYISTDYYADLSNFRPMRARSFFELGLAYLGSPKLLSWFEGKGFDGDHALVELEQDTLPASLFLMEQDPLRARAQPSEDYLNALGKRAQLNQYSGFDETLPELPKVHPYRALLKGDGELTLGQFLAAARQLELFEEEQEVPSIMGICLRHKVTGPQLEQCSAYLRAGDYNKPCGPTGYELEQCALYYKDGDKTDELLATLAALALVTSSPTPFNGEDADYKVSVSNPQMLKVQPVMEALVAQGLTQEELLPVSWSKHYKTLRLRSPAPQASTPWVELSFIGPPRPEGENPLVEAELIYDDELPAQQLQALHTLFDELGVSRDRWRPL